MLLSRVRDPSVARRFAVARANKKRSRFNLSLGNRRKGIGTSRRDNDAGRWLIGSEFISERGGKSDTMCVRGHTRTYLTLYTRSLSLSLSLSLSRSRKRVFIERRYASIRRRELFRRLRVTGLLEIDDDAGPASPRARAQSPHPGDFIPRPRATPARTDSREWEREGDCGCGVQHSLVLQRSAGETALIRCTIT